MSACVSVLGGMLSMNQLVTTAGRAVSVQADLLDKLPVTCAVLNPDPVLVKGKNLNNVARQFSCCTTPWACSCMAGWGGSPLQASRAEPCQGCCGVIVNATVEGHVLPDQPPRSGCCGRDVPGIEDPDKSTEHK